MATPEICSIAGCGKKHFLRTWCAAHYDRWRNHGDPLGGGTANGAPRRFFEETVLSYDGEECLIWPFARNSAGYGHIYTGTKTELVSRLACTAVHGPAPHKAEAAHTCGKGHLGCVAGRHLMWKTAQENSAEKAEHGTQNRADLTDDEVREIRALRGTVSQAKLSTRFGIHQTTISRIQLGKGWEWVT